MLAGDSVLIILLVFWMASTIGPWWLGFGGIGVALILNYIHTYIIIRQRIHALEEIAAKTGMPLPPHIQTQIDEMKQKGFCIWGSLQK